MFWKNVCALFSDKTLSKISKTALLEKGEIVTEDTKLTETFNTFFSNRIKTLNFYIQRTYGESKKDLDSKKCSPQNDISVKLPKLNAVIVSSFISKIFNESIKNVKFQDSLKLTDINPVYKENNHNNKAYYKSVSILPAFSKICEKCLYDQIYKKNVDSIFSECQYIMVFTTEGFFEVAIESWPEWHIHIYIYIYSYMILTLQSMQMIQLYMYVIRI